MIKLRLHNFLKIGYGYDTNIPYPHSLYEDNYLLLTGYKHPETVLIWDSLPGNLLKNKIATSIKLQCPYGIWKKKYSTYVI